MLYNDYLQAGGERNSVRTEVAALQAGGVTVKLLTVENSALASAGVVRKIRTTLPSRSVESVLTREIDSFKPDVVHAQNLFPQLGANAINSLRRAGVPWVRTLRNYRKGCIAGTLMREERPCASCAGRAGLMAGVVHSCYRGGILPSLGATSYALYESRAERNYPPSAYICVSDAMRAALRFALDPTVPTEVIHNAVIRPPNLEPIPAGARYFDVAFVGRMSEEKGVRLALEVARDLSGVRVAFAGAGPLSSLVKHVAATSDRVQYFDDLDQHGAIQLMSNSRTVIVPSQWAEPFGRVAAEALAAGALPIVSNRGGLPEIVADLGYQAVVSSDRIDDWAAAIRRISSLDLGRAQLFSNQASQRWTEQFSQRSIAARLIDTYESHCSQKLAR